MIDELMNLGSLYEKPSGSLELLSEAERTALAELEAEARARMEAAEGDPSQQRFFMRLDTKTVVKDEKEYLRCQAKQIPLKVIPYGYALHLLKEGDAAKRRRLKDKRKKKVAKQARKRNRSK